MENIHKNTSLIDSLQRLLKRYKLVYLSFYLENVNIVISSTEQKFLH